MRPVPINLTDLPEGFTRQVMAAPNGDLTDQTVGPLEVAVGPVQGEMVFFSKWIFEPGDMEELLEKGHLWLGVRGMQPVVMMIAGNLYE
jgi:hypothetical protein